MDVNVKKGPKMVETRAFGLVSYEDRSEEISEGLTIME